MPCERPRLDGGSYIPHEACNGREWPDGTTANDLVGYPWAHRGKERRGLPGVTAGETATARTREREQVTILGRIDPQPPPGIKYMLGNETWMPSVERSPLRLHCEEWGNLGPMELDPDIKPNKAGFRVRCTTILPPAGARGFEKVDGVYYWTDVDMYRLPSSRPSRIGAADGAR